MYKIEFTPEAVEDLKALRKFEQEEVVDGIESQLRHEPTVETRNRKKLRPHNVAAMKTVMVSARSRTLNDLLKKARRTGLILQSADGQRFVLTSVEQWEGFDVGADDDFAREVKKTARNKKLMKFLAGRRSNGKRIPLAKVKEELGLN
jgi:hypothetical protein